MGLGEFERALSLLGGASLLASRTGNDAMSILAEMDQIDIDARWTADLREQLRRGDGMLNEFQGTTGSWVGGIYYRQGAL